MKYTVPTLALLALLLFGCAGEATDPKTETNESIDPETETFFDEGMEPMGIEEFTSVIDPDKSDWDLGATYSDTLELIGYNDDGDYAFATFKTKAGKYVDMYTNENVDEYYQNRDFVVEWQIDDYYEAGEGEALYYNESLKDFEMLNTCSSLERFITDFTPTYQKGYDADLSTFINPEVELISSYNQALYCLPTNRNDISGIPSFNFDYIISAEKPGGDICGGYPGVEDGFYYEFIDETQLPTFDDPMGEPPQTLYIEPHIEYWYFAKVTLIFQEEFNRTLYLFNGNEKWYLWVENFCDCSA